MYGLSKTMRNAMRLMRAGGKLAEATREIQRGLGQFSATGTAADSPAYVEGRRARVREAPVDGGTFTRAHYSGPEGSRSYKLFMPAGRHAAPLPLVVMLHGCKQDPDDFALGTGMNLLAAELNFAVAYPEQASSANGMKCWNWFQGSDQQRDRGEPAIIAGITRELVRKHGFDRGRVYVAGLSAGGAMAVVMGRTYPDLYAAVGVHSGVPYALAHDVPSAFAAMKGNLVSPQAGRAEAAALIPTIVMHGDRDRTVHPGNGEQLAQQFGAVAGGASLETDGGFAAGEAPRSHGGRTCTRTRLRDKGGKVVVEYWLVHGAGHAWFGGNPNASHADARGPDASREMLRFFSSHQLGLAA